MPSRILPSPEELPRLVLSPESTLWRVAGDARVLVTAAGYALLLQVAHPTVGAGVRDHSDFAADPWGRLMRTLDFTNLLVYGRPAEVAQLGERLRGMHRPIKGTGFDGNRYHALEPEAFAWVHATLLDGIVSGHRQFGRSLSQSELESAYADWRGLGRIIGVRERDLPEGWLAFEAYLRRMKSERLADNPTIHSVMRTLREPKRPPLPGLTQREWRVARAPLVHLLSLATAGLLGPDLRRRFGFPWSAAHEFELRALSRASRASGPLLPRPLRVMGPAYLRMRREAIARGPFGTRDRLVQAA